MTQTPHADLLGIAGRARARSVAAPDHQPRRGRRLRREDAGRRGDPGRLAGAPPGSRALDRDAQREHGRTAPRPRTALDFTLGGTRDGKMLAYRLDLLQDCGAYPVLGSFLPNLTLLMSSGVYAIPEDRGRRRLRGHEHDAHHLLPWSGPARGGQAIERAIDLFAAEIGLDPTRCAGEPDPERRLPAHDASHADVRLRKLRGRARPRARSAGLDELRAEQAGAARRARSSSWGSASSVTSRSPTRSPRREFGEVEIAADGAPPFARAHSRTARVTRRPSRRSSRIGSGCRSSRSPSSRATRTTFPGNGHLRLEVDADRHHCRPGRGGRGRRARPGARRRLPRGERGRHRARPGLGRFHVGGSPSRGCLGGARRAGRRGRQDSQS